MDYETIDSKIPCISNDCGPCRLGLHRDLVWNEGEIVELELPICGRIYLDEGVYLTPEDFLKDSNTKYIKMELQNFLGDIINTQFSKNPNIIYSDGQAICYYIIDKELSNKLKSGTYYLFVSMLNTLPKTETLPERTIFNIQVSVPEGTQITIL